MGRWLLSFCTAVLLVGSPAFSFFILLAKAIATASLLLSLSSVSAGESQGAMMGMVMVCLEGEKKEDVWVGLAITSDGAFDRLKEMAQSYICGSSTTNSLSSGTAFGARMGISLHLMTTTPIGVCDPSLS